MTTGRQPASGETIDLNQAVLAYIPHTLTDNHRFEQWLATFPPAVARPVRAMVPRLVDEAMQYCYDEPGGVSLKSDFTLRLFQRIRASYPWITEPSLRRVEGHLMWYCWHEGLFAPGEV